MRTTNGEPPVWPDEARAQVAGLEKRNKELEGRIKALKGEHRVRETEHGRTYGILAMLGVVFAVCLVMGAC